jgi:hypothetical protein
MECVKIEHGRAAENLSGPSAPAMQLASQLLKATNGVVASNFVYLPHKAPEHLAFSWGGE